MAVMPYVNFNGNCREAVNFYAKVFGIPAPKIFAFGDMPPSPDSPMSEDTKKLVMHTELELEGGTIMFSDAPPEYPCKPGDSISIMISTKDEKVIRRYWEQLKNGGTVAMELGPQFWSPLYGFVTDKFGLGWQFYLEE